MRKIRGGTQGRLSGDIIDFEFVIVVEQEDGTASTITDIAGPMLTQHTADELALIDAINTNLIASSQPELSDDEIERYAKMLRGALILAQQMRIR